MIISFEQLVDEVKSARAIVVDDNEDEDVFFPEVLNDGGNGQARIRLIYTDENGEQYSNDISAKSIKGDITFEGGRVALTTSSDRMLKLELLTLKTQNVIADNDLYTFDIAPYAINGRVNPLALAFGLAHKRGSRATLLTTYIDGARYRLALNGASEALDTGDEQVDTSDEGANKHLSHGEWINNIVTVDDRRLNNMPHFQWFDKAGHSIYLVPVKTISVNPQDEIDRLKVALNENDEEDAGSSPR